jgi:hypothetical protein
MPTREQATGWMLSNTTVAEEAAKYADQLGNLMVGYEPRVAFPPKWVLAKQKASAKIAAYAVLHCNDVPTLNSLATSPSVTKRISVLEALHANKNLPAKTKTAVLSMIKQHYNPSPLSTLTSITDAFTEAIATMSCPDDLDAFDEPLMHLQVTPAVIDGLFNELVSTHPIWAALSYIASKTGVTDMNTYHEFWTKGTVTPVEALAKLLGPDQHRVLHDLLHLATDNYFTKLFDAKIDDDLVLLMMRSVDPSTVKTSRGEPLYARPTFTDAATELLLGDRAWHNILWYQELNANQMKRLIADTPASRRVLLLGIAHEDHAIVEAILSSLPADAIIDDTAGVEAVLRTLEYRGDPLFELMLSHCSGYMVLDYLTGGWQIGRASVLPSVDRIPELSARTKGIATTTVIEHLHTTLGFQYRPSRNYQNAIIDHLPGALEYVLTEKSHNEYVYERLSTTGASPELVLDQLVFASGSTLNNLCDVLSALVRVATTK